MLHFAGRFADIVGVNPSIHRARSTPTPPATPRPTGSTRRSRVREGAGDRFDDLELNAWVAAANYTDDPPGFADQLAFALRRP